MKTCERCGRPSKYSLCTLCDSIDKERREARERQEEADAERLEQLRQFEWARNNPGEYECPACLYRTLKYLASRCPMCHAEPGDEYWAPISERNRAERRAKEERERAAREAWEKGAPAREKAQAEKVRREKLRAPAYVICAGLFYIYTLWLFPILVLLTYTYPHTELVWPWGANSTLAEFCFTPFIGHVALGFATLMFVLFDHRGDRILIYSADKLLMSIAIWAFVGFLLYLAASNLEKKK